MTVAIEVGGVLICTFSVFQTSRKAGRHKAKVGTRAQEAGRKSVLTQPGPRCRSKRFCFMHLAAATGFFSLPLVPFLLTPTGRSMVATVWTWLKGALGKLLPGRILFVVQKESPEGGKFHLLLSTHDGPTVTQLFQGSHASLLQQLPPALGSERPTAPHLPSNPEAVQSPLPSQLTAPQLLDSNESRSRPTRAAVPGKKRPQRTRASRRPRSSRRMDCGCRSSQSASMRKKG